MIDFSTLQGLTIPEGVVTQITDAAGNVLWSAVKPEPVVLEVAKQTSDTYVGSTLYTGEQFVLLDIYPKNANSTVTVTYGGLTKTLTFSGTNAQQVYFGTFGGVADSVTTPDSGTLTIEGGYAAYGCGGYKNSSDSKAATQYCPCITAVSEWGNIKYIPNGAFRNCTSVALTSLPSGITSIGDYAFYYCSGLTNITIPEAVTSIGDYAFYLANSSLTITLNSVPKFGGSHVFAVPGGTYDYTIRTIYFEVESIDWDKWASGNPPHDHSEEDVFLEERYTHDCRVYINGTRVTNLTGTIELKTCTTISNYAFYHFYGVTFSSLPSGITSIGDYAFYYCSGLTSVTIPSSVTSIGSYAFYYCSGLTNITIPEAVTSIGQYAFAGCTGLTSVAFENATGWAVKTSTVATSGTEVDVTDAANNVTLLKSTYVKYYWYRS